MKGQWCWIAAEGVIETYTSTVLLPPLPAQLSMLNGITMKNFIRGLMKDLKLTWASQKPVWWPTEIPYQNINSAPRRTTKGS